MRNKASLLLAALLVLPAAALAQTPPPAPPATGPTAPMAPGEHMRHHMTWSPADMAAMQAQMAKLQAAMAKAEAAHKATRAKILAALTPAHKAYLANLIGQLAVAANPDPKAATAKLDATLSASEKSKILAIHSAAMAQMMSQMKTMMPPMAREGAPPAGAPPMPPMGGDRHVTMFVLPDGGHAMERMHHSMTAGEILMHLAAGREPMGAPMMMLRHPHPMIPATPPLAPMAPVTPAPQPTP